MIYRQTGQNYFYTIPSWKEFAHKNSVTGITFPILSVKEHCISWKTTPGRKREEHLIKIYQKRLFIQPL